MEDIAINSRLLGGVRIDSPTDSQLSVMPLLLDDGRNHQICFISQKDIGKVGSGDEFSSMLASADLVLPLSPFQWDRKSRDAEGGKFQKRLPVPLRHKPYIESVEFSESYPASGYSALKTITTMLAGLERLSGSIFLLGGRPSTLQRAEANLRSTFPSIRLVGRAPGDYSAQEEPSVLLAMQKSTPDIFVIGSLVRGGELWIPRHMAHTRSGIFVYAETIIETFAGSR